MGGQPRHARAAGPARLPVRVQPNGCRPAVRPANRRRAHGGDPRRDPRALGGRRRRAIRVAARDLGGRRYRESQQDAGDVDAGVRGRRGRWWVLRADDPSVLLRPPVACGGRRRACTDGSARRTACGWPPGARSPATWSPLGSHRDTTRRSRSPRRPGDHAGAGRAARRPARRPRVHGRPAPSVGGGSRVRWVRHPRRRDR